MKVISIYRNLNLLGVAACLMLAVSSGAHALSSQGMAESTASANSHDYERIIAHLRGAYGPRSFFNLVVGLYSYPLPGLYGAQFNIKAGLMVLDIAPGFPHVDAAQMHHIEKISGYSPGPVEIQEIQASKFAETGPGWRKIQPPKSRYAFVRWIKQNFINHHY